MRANLDTASEHVGYVNKPTAARSLKQAFSCMATNNLLISCISYEARYKEYHHQKLALKSRNISPSPTYLATLLRTNNAKDVKELMAYVRKNVAKVLAGQISSLH